MYGRMCADRGAAIRQAIAKAIVAYYQKCTWRKREREIMHKEGMEGKEGEAVWELRQN